MLKNIKNVSGKIGVTGGTGVLGSILCRKLKKNYTVVKFNHDIQNVLKVKEWVKKNNFDAIFHLASIASVKLCNENPLKACSTNIIGTKNLLRVYFWVKEKTMAFLCINFSCIQRKKNHYLKRMIFPLKHFMDIPNGWVRN